MKAVIGFIALLIGCGGNDTICSVIALIGAIICLKESKKIDVQPASRNVY